MPWRFTLKNEELFCSAGRRGRLGDANYDFHHGAKQNGERVHNLLPVIVLDADLDGWLKNRVKIHQIGRNPGS